MTKTKEKRPVLVYLDEEFRKVTTAQELERWTDYIERHLLRYAKEAKVSRVFGRMPQGVLVAEIDGICWWQILKLRKEIELAFAGHMTVKKAPGE